MDFDVIVVGFGPTGAVAAGWLGQFGIRTLVIEKSPNVWDIPRAIALDHEVMRVFQNLGVVDEILPHTAPFRASEHFGALGQLIRRIDVVPPPHPLGYDPTLVFTQPAVEAILRRHVARHPNVTVKLGCAVTAVEQQPAGVIVRATAPDGSTSQFGGRYLIACDGASSTIRQLAGIALEDLSFDEPWMVVDVVVNGDALEKLPQTAAQFCDPARPTTFIIGPGAHRRWEIMLNPGEDPREMERPENVWRLLARWLTPGQGKLWRASSYRFHALLAERWRAGGVFLAGDAAHQQPPFIGQGMCQGIRDATNLCWKLRAVLDGASADALLDTYATERKQHVRVLTERIKAIGRHICERDPEAARLRDVELLRQGGGVAPVVTRQQIVPPLQQGLLLDAGSGSASGTLFPQPWVVSESGRHRLLDEVTGHGWRVVMDGRRTARFATPPNAMAAFVTIGGPEGLREREGVLGSWFDREGCIAALVRPDHYVFGTSATRSEVAGLLESASKAMFGSIAAESRRGRPQVHFPNPDG